MEGNDYEIQVQIYIRPLQGMGTLNMGETHVVRVKTIADMAGIMVKLHEFFQDLGKAEKKTP